MPRRGSILPVRRRFPPPCERIFTPTVTSTVQGVYRRPRWQQVEKEPRFSGFMDVPGYRRPRPRLFHQHQLSSALPSDVVEASNRATSVDPGRTVMRTSGNEQNATFHQRPASLAKGSARASGTTRSHLQIEFSGLCLLLLGAQPAMAFAPFSFPDESNETNSLTVAQETTLKTHRLAFLTPTDFKGMS